MYPRKKRSKLDQKDEVGILVGYNNSTKGYKTYQPLTGELIVSKTVSFNESAA